MHFQHIFFLWIEDELKKIRDIYFCDLGQICKKKDNLKKHLIKTVKTKQIPFWWRHHYTRRSTNYTPSGRWMFSCHGSWSSARERFRPSSFHRTQLGMWTGTTTERINTVKRRKIRQYPFRGKGGWELWGLWYDRQFDEHTKHVVLDCSFQSWRTVLNRLKINAIFSVW